MSRIDELLADPKFKQLMISNPDKAREFVSQMKQQDFGIMPHSENLLTNAIKNSRIGPFGGTSITAVIPTNVNEATDLAKVAGRQIPMTRGQDVNFATEGPAGIGLNISGIHKSDAVIPPPETQYGKNLETSADAAPWIGMGLEGATGAVNGVKNFFSEGDLPQQIDKIKGNISDIVQTGPQKVKDRVSQLFDEFGKNFADKLKSIDGQATHYDFADALEKTANKLGAVDIQGSEGNQLMQKANQFRLGGAKIYTPVEIQAETKNILNSLKNPVSKAEFYSNFIDTLSQSNKAPELVALKQEHAPIYDIAKKSKQLKSGALNRVASGKIGPEEFANLTEAQQMLGDNPNIVEQADASGRMLQDKQSQLQKIIGRQNTAKKIGKGAIGLGKLGLGYEIISHLLKK